MIEVEKRPLTVGYYGTKWNADAFKKMAGSLFDDSDRFNIIEFPGGADICLMDYWESLRFPVGTFSGVIVIVDSEGYGIPQHLAKLKNVVYLGIPDQQLAGRAISVPGCSMSFFERNDHTPLDLIKQRRVNPDARFCAYMVSKKHPHREQFFNRIVEAAQEFGVRDADALGQCYGDYPNQQNRQPTRESMNRDDEAVALYSNYKFVMAFENKDKPGYVTEKILNAFLAGAVPIYWGSSTAVEIFNLNSFVWVNQYPDIKGAIDRILGLTQHENQYQQMLSEPILNPGSLDRYFSWHFAVTNEYSSIKSKIVSAVTEIHDRLIKTQRFSTNSRNSSRSNNLISAQNNQSIPKPNPHWQLESQSSGVYLCNSTDSKTIQCNQVAALIWRICDGQRSVIDCINHLTQTYPDAVNQIDEDFRWTVEHFARQDAITILYPDELLVNSNPADFNGSRKIKLYSIYTPSHRKLAEDWFFPSIPDEYEQCVEIVDINSQEKGMTKDQGEFLERDWMLAISKKVELILRAIEENWGHWFVFSDIDVQFFGNTLSIIKPLIEENDIVLQKENPEGLFCTGFFACKGNELTRALWCKVLNLVSYEDRRHDQRAFNVILRKQLLSTLPSVGYLPECFMGGGTFSGRTWQPGDDLEVSRNVVVHHANFCVGIEAKIQQLNLVRNIVLERKEQDK